MNSYHKVIEEREDGFYWCKTRQSGERWVVLALEDGQWGLGPTDCQASVLEVHPERLLTPDETPSMTADVKELKALAKKASKGPWRLRVMGDDFFVEAPGEPDMPYRLDVCGDDYAGHGDDEQRRLNFEFIAACHPDNVLALLKRLVDAELALNDAQACLGNMTANRDGWEAVAARMEGSYQELASYAERSAVFIQRVFDEYNSTGHLSTVTCLKAGQLLDDKGSEVQQTIKAIRNLKEKEADAQAAKIESLKYLLVDALRCVSAVAHPGLHDATLYQELAKRVMTRIEAKGNEQPAISLLRRDVIMRSEGIAQAAKRWPPGSVVRSRLLELAEEAAKLKPNIAETAAGRVAD